MQGSCSSSGQVCPGNLPRVPVSYAPYQRASNGLLLPVVESPSKAERPENRYIQLVILFLLNIFTFCLISNILLLVFKYHIVCYLISSWKVELTSFAMGSASSLSESFRGDFHHPLVPEQYVYVNFTLSIRNNPSWLKINVQYVDLRYAIGYLGYRSRASIVFSGDTELTVLHRVRQPNRVEHICLHHILATEQSVPGISSLKVKPSFFGYEVDLLELTSLVSFVIPRRNFHGVDMDEDMARACEDLYRKQLEEMVNNVSTQVDVTSATLELATCLPVTQRDKAK